MGDDVVGRVEFEDLVCAFWLILHSGGCSGVARRLFRRLNRSFGVQCWILLFAAHLAEFDPS